MIPSTHAILDALEWCAERIVDADVIDHHGFWNHDHLRWNREAGLQRFVGEVNQVLARSQLAFEMEIDGWIRRLAEGPGSEQLKRATFATGDSRADELLEQARRRFFDRDADAGQNSVEALWDAFERIKTLEDSNKSRGIERLIRLAACSQAEGDLLDAECSALTVIGNKWSIRHHEVSQHPIGSSRGLRDYFFLRMFALLRHLLEATRRMSDN